MVRRPHVSHRRRATTGGATRASLRSSARPAAIALKPAARGVRCNADRDPQTSRTLSFLALTPGVISKAPNDQAEPQTPDATGTAPVSMHTARQRVAVGSSAWLGFGNPYAKHSPDSKPSPVRPTPDAATGEGRMHLSTSTRHSRTFDMPIGYSLLQMSAAPTATSALRRRLASPASLASERSPFRSDCINASAFIATP